ncbi:MAG: hypothetical protein ACXW2C_10840, partial [Acidimicrobiia bacterium]
MSRVPPSVRGRRLPVACFLVIASVLLALGVSPGPAVAADEHHAAVIVDTGSDVHQVVITFTEDSISGLEALQQAGANPVILGFSGIGGAVCSLYDVGHPATSSTCLGLPDDPRFWAYWHVPSGQSAFNDSTYSRAGAGSVRVRDGDTEGWRYGTGEPPTFVQLAFPEPPAPAATAPPVAGPGPAPSGGSSGAAGGGSTTVTPGSRSSNPSSSNPSSSNPSSSSSTVVPGSAGVAAASGSTTTT